MKWIPDRTGRFSERPFYERDELDYECERVISDFLVAKYGAASYPISTNNLTILLEQVVSVLDLYADLSSEGDYVEAVTEFVPRSKPRVRVTQALTNQPFMENRLRTTLTHELGHVKHHSFLWADGQLPLFNSQVPNSAPKCKRETILGASEVDWMEWQAGYASGAYLMPITPLRRIARAILDEGDAQDVVLMTSPVGLKLIEEVRIAFQVSEEAARVRLLKRGLLLEQAPSSPLNAHG